jgi:hypothetical protein
MWALLKAARRAYHTWRTIDPEHRETMAAEAQRVRALAVELGGSAAARFVDGSADSLDGADKPPSGNGKRPRQEVTAELKVAVEALARACGIPAVQVFADSTPRSVRLGARLATAGARRAASRTKEQLGPGDRPRPAAPGPAWYDDPAGRFDFRYWDGREWTHHVSRAGAAEVDPLGAA